MSMRMHIFRVKKPSCKILKRKTVFHLRCNIPVVHATTTGHNLPMKPRRYATLTPERISMRI